MSRVANKPVDIPKGVDVTVAKSRVQAKGSLGNLEVSIHPSIEVKQVKGETERLHVSAIKSSKAANALAGTTRALLNNLVTGVEQGFTKQLELVGVGYRAQVQGNVINLSLGYSHPVQYTLPANVSVEMPSNTSILLKSANKQLLGKVAAQIKELRPPEPYKGKGIRYTGEMIILKEIKKK